MFTTCVSVVCIIYLLASLTYGQEGRGRKNIQEMAQTGIKRRG